MATQAIVTVIDPDQVILLKVIVGSGGYNAEQLAEYLTRTRNIDPEGVLAEAKAMGMGDVVVIGMDEHAKEEGIDEVPARYFATFRERSYNPRWMRGTADHVYVVFQQDNGEDRFTKIPGRERMLRFQYPATEEEIEVGVQAHLRGELFPAVDLNSDKFFEILGRLVAHKYVEVIPWLRIGDKSFDEIAKGEE